MLMDETDVQGPEHKMIQEMHAEWAQGLCEVQRKFADDMASKNDRCEKRSRACPRATRSSGPQTEVRRI